MNPDDELCLCFHVTRRKVEQFLRNERPAVASQLSNCYGAGTGCGWCRPFLQKLHRQFVGGEFADGPPTRDSSSEQELPAAAAYAEQRAVYRGQQAKPTEDRSLPPPAAARVSPRQAP